MCGVLLAAVAVLSATPRSRSDITGLDGLVRAYDAILDARFEQAEIELKKACPPAPLEACDVLTATATWWRILLDPDNRALDRQFSFAGGQK